VPEFFTFVLHGFTVGILWLFFETVSYIKQNKKPIAYFLFG